MSLYSWSFHFDKNICQQLRILKRELAKLCLSHVFDLSTSGLRDFDIVIFSTTIIWRFLPWKNRKIESQPITKSNPLWNEFETKIRKIYLKYFLSKDREGFVYEAMKIVDRMYVEAEHFEDLHEKIEGERLIENYKKMNWFGCFRYTVEDEKDFYRAEVHINNNVAPESPFSDKEREFNWFKSLVDDIYQKHPEVKDIGTGSWLNNNKGFLELYPPEYEKSLVQITGEEKQGMGWWGQFIRKDLTLNQHRANILLNEKRFDCLVLRGVCKLKDLKRHVSANL